MASKNKPGAGLNPKPNANRQATLADIARKAEISVSAVSRILAEKRIEFFAEATIAKVRAIAAELRYRPNSLIRGIQTGKTGVVGVVGFAQGDFYGEVLLGIHDELVTQGRLPIVAWSRLDSPLNTGRTELEQIHALVDQRVEGIILKPVVYGSTDTYFQEILERNIPLVVVDRALPGTNCCYVGSDDNEGIAAVMEHLKKLKHRHICFFGADTVVSTGLARLQAFRFFVSQDKEIEPVEHMVQNWTPTVEDALECLNKNPQTSAVVAVNDQFAWMIYQAAAVKKLRIPEDLSVVGYGNRTIATHLLPHLTSVDQHPYDIGTSAARRLLMRIENSAERPRKIMLSCDLVVRESTAEARR